MESKEIVTTFWFENFVGKDNLGDPGINVRIFLKRTLVA
jgi:hypothetical protein